MHQAPEKQQLLFENTARSVGGASVDIQKRHIANCTKKPTLLMAQVLLKH